MSDFGDTLKAIRVERGWSQEEMAERLGTSKQVLSRYETGKRVPKVTTVAQFADKLGVPLERMAGSNPFCVNEKIEELERIATQLTPENYQLLSDFATMLLHKQ